LHDSSARRVRQREQRFVELKFRTQYYSTLRLNVL
jgi:hypothetical protein